MVLIWCFQIKCWLHQSCITHSWHCLYWSCIVNLALCICDCHYHCFGSFNCCLQYGLYHALTRCHYFLLFNQTALCEYSSFLSSSLPYVRLLSFNFWHYLVLVTLKEGNTTGSFYLCHLLYMLSVIYVSDYICTGMCCVYIQLWYVQMVWLSICVHMYFLKL